MSFRMQMSTSCLIGSTTGVLSTGAALIRLSTGRVHVMPESITCTQIQALTSADITVAAWHPLMEDRKTVAYFINMVEAHKWHMHVI